MKRLVGQCPLHLVPVGEVLEILEGGYEPGSDLGINLGS